MNTFSNIQGTKVERKKLELEIELFGKTYELFGPWEMIRRQIKKIIRDHYGEDVYFYFDGSQSKYGCGGDYIYINEPKQIGMRSYKDKYGNRFNRTPKQ